MLTTRIDLQGLEETVTRSIVIIAVRDIKRLLGITRDIYTTYDANDALIKKKNAVGEIQGENTFKEDMITLETSETSEEGEEVSLVVYRPDFKPIYEDKELRASFTPIYHKRKMSIKFKYSTKSKSSAFSIANKIRLFTATDAMYQVHDLEYYFLVPTFLVKLLATINNLKNTRLPDSEKLTLEQYINNTFDNRVDLTNTLDADLSKSTLVIREAQLGITGYMADDPYTIQPEYDDSFTSWNIEFTYEFTYEKPVTILVKYPLLVYNNLIPKPFRIFVNPNTRAEDNPRAHRTGRRYGIDPITTTNNPLKLSNDKYYLSIPKIDQEVLPKPADHLSRLFSVLCILDDNDPTLLFNIQDIPEVEIKEEILDYLMAEREYITEDCNSLFYLELFKDNKKEYNNKIIIEGNGTLRTTYPLDYKGEYRVVLNICKDMTMLHINARKRLKDFILSQLGTNEFKDKNVFIDEIYKDLKVNSSVKNIVASYIRILGAKPENVYDIMHKSNKYIDIMYDLTSVPRFRRTVMVNLASVLRVKEKKENKSTI